ncbi:MAG TPA: HEAT repeat domain-containing protein, partial [Polyangium sp.]|nr:HEAT repeat domain-containing protein [Polyangium sp.]
IRARRFERLTSNTLLLTLLVLLFQKSEKIPQSRMLILQEIVKTVEEIEREKPRSHRDLDWDVKLRLLSTLAFRTVQEGDGYSLGDSSTKESLRAAIKQLEDSRDLRAGMSWGEVLACLEVTGFVRREGTGVTFWHRAFLEYFAAIEASRLLMLEQLDLSDWVRRTRYEAILPIALAMLPESRWDIIKTVGQLNCFVAAEALAEMGSRGTQLVDDIIPHLRRCLCSEFHSVRNSAMETLSRISSPAVDALMRDLLRDGAPDIQIAALVEIARRRLPDARAIINERSIWDVRDEFSFSSGGQQAIYRALGELGDRDVQRLLVDGWKAADVRWIGFEASLALRSIARRGELCPDIESELCNWFVGDNNDDNDLRYYVLEDLKPVLVASASVSSAREIAQYIVRTDGTRRGHGWPTIDVDILASFEDPSVVQLIADLALDTTLPIRTRRSFARALADSAGEIPFNACVSLSSDADYFIRAEGIGALARFPFAEIKTLLLSAFGDVSHKNNNAPTQGHERLQAACVAALARHGQLRLLLQDEIAPCLLYRGPLEQLLSAMGAQRITELVPFLRGFISPGLKTRLLASAALAFGEVGELELARKIFEDILEAPDREPYAESDLIEGAHRLQPEDAIRWIDRIWEMDGHDRRNMVAYTSHIYIEALEKIGTEQATQRLIALLAQKSDNKDYDRLDVLRALHEVVTRDMEGWLIDLHESNRFNGRFERSWILSMLGKVGTERAESILVQSLNAGDKWQRHTTFRALQDLWRQRGYVWFNGEETSAVEQPKPSEEPSASRS